MVNPVVVISHERSGTHFLINTIRLHFGFEPGVVNFPFAMPELGKAAVSDADPAVIRKSHHQAQCFGHQIDELLARNHVFYIIRDCRAVMVSLFHYWEKSDSFPNPESLKELAVMDPQAEPWDQYRVGNPSTMVERWTDHISGWEPFFDRLTVVTYENLSNRFREEVMRIGCVLGRHPQEPIQKPPLRKNVVTVHRGLADGWMDEMTQRLSAKIWRMAGPQRRWLSP